MKREVVERVGVILESFDTETIDGGVALRGDGDRVNWSGRGTVVGIELNK